MIVNCIYYSHRGQPELNITIILAIIIRLQNLGKQKRASEGNSIIWTLWPITVEQPSLI